MLLIDKIKRQLKWYEDTDRIFETRDDGSGKYLLLVLDWQNGITTEMGFVSITSDKKFWWFTTNPNIVCKQTAGHRYKKVQDAQSDMLEYVASEVERIMRLNKQMPLKRKHKLRSQDKRACKAYLQRRMEGKRPNATEVVAHKAGFADGFDWALKSVGMSAPPEWANFMVQNQDGSITYFENKPRVNNIHSTKWECEDGRSETVRLHPESWTGTIRRVAPKRSEA